MSLSRRSRTARLWGARTVPYARYEESVHGVSEQIKGQTGAVAFGLDGFGRLNGCPREQREMR